VRLALRPLATVVQTFLKLSLCDLTEGRITFRHIETRQPLAAHLKPRRRH